MRIDPLRPSLTALAVLCALSSACKDKPRATPAAPPHVRPAVLAQLPVYPRSTKSDTTGTDEVERGTWVVQQRLALVGPFFRDTLPKLGWQLMSNEADSAKLDLYAQRDSISLWVHVEALGTLATRYTLIAGKTGAAGASGPIGTAAPPRN